jgi:hypothetical protein
MASAVSSTISKRQQKTGVPSKRFVCSDIDIEWTLTDSDGINYIISQLLLKSASWSSIDQSIKELQAIVRKNPSMSEVCPLLNEARQKSDITPLLRAYTLECGFYKSLNKSLAQRVNVSSMGNPIQTLVNLFVSNVKNNTSTDDWPMYFVGPIFSDMFSTNKSRYHFTGRTYRGMRISQNDFDRYAIGKLLFNKAFTSTSKLREVAMRFTDSQVPQQPQDNKMAALFIFTFEQNTFPFTIDLKDISEFPDEEEILIMPGIPFRIAKIRRGNPTEIVLEQVDINHLLGK